MSSTAPAPARRPRQRQSQRQLEGKIGLLHRLPPAARRGTQSPCCPQASRGAHRELGQEPGRARRRRERVGFAMCSASGLRTAFTCSLPGHITPQYFRCLAHAAPCARRPCERVPGLHVAAGTHAGRACRRRRAPRIQRPRDDAVDAVDACCDMHIQGPSRPNPPPEPHMVRFAARGQAASGAASSSRTPTLDSALPARRRAGGMRGLRGLRGLLRLAVYALEVRETPMPPRFDPSESLSRALATVYSLLLQLRPRFLSLLSAWSGCFGHLSEHNLLSRSPPCPAHRDLARIGPRCPWPAHRGPA
ncbi:uncharacterized protein BDZ99DRAFT_478393 [Mytilinidion resinicola]|uniref:Uncharacterized protein n=1 Tax=Mytilinidion resinicola TaxID=574789 RepID=A0A6A6YH00_9PEZI|nr:uncharacterized protein BDZ99DRAFT_478393 [Mytilinidion resinicola]KAF2807869.1 hypothetical protein BDZ99DRAFT_478393 [Mytilinidion resinicola]